MSQISWIWVSQFRKDARWYGGMTGPPFDKPLKMCFKDLDGVLALLYLLLVAKY